MYLIDTNVVSEARNQARANPGVLRFAQNATAALIYDLTLVTRNVADIAGTGVRLENPSPTA